MNDRRKNPQTGEWEDVPNFVDCVVFGKYGEKLAQSLAKGAKACVDGSLRYSAWERDGQRRSKIEVVANTIEVMPRNKQDTEPLPPVDAYGEDLPF